MTAVHGNLQLLVDGDTSADTTVTHTTEHGWAFVDVHAPTGGLCLSGPPDEVTALCRRLLDAARKAEALAAVRERLRDDAATIQHLVTEPSAG